MSYHYLRILTYTFAALYALASPAWGLEVASEAAKVRFGLMKKDADGRWLVSKETSEIPLNLSDPDFRFGFVVEHAGGVGYAVLHFPSTTHRVGATLDGADTGRTPDMSERTLTTTRVSFEERFGGDFQLDDESDAGDYSVDIFIDDVRVRTVRFKVVPRSK